MSSNPSYSELLWTAPLVGAIQEKRGRRNALAQNDGGAATNPTNPTKAPQPRRDYEPAVEAAPGTTSVFSAKPTVGTV